ncbi:DUF4173 domain-containing protein [Paenibacillus sp. J5C_2022]|uniref:DUF4153 domain-containing protein n=1 Tax=Paenibacillus sp. J5C2022 TaxID=2977129 RepID=UPI0021CDFB31|nr:DUF4173 domain-containing protein [Paenibacillus sp. J5C2022]MCU6711763.1 DUF4173 domain-containing protein [Paenibacillus sp. J5C2022]
MRNPAPWRQRYDGMLRLAILLGLFGQYLFLGRAAGLSVPLYLLCVYGMFFYAARGRMGGFERWRGQLRSGLLLLIPIFLLSLTYILYSNLFFHRLNAIVLIILVTAQMMLLTKGGSVPWHRLQFYREMVRQLFVQPVLHIREPFLILGGWLRAGDAEGKERSHILKVLSGMLIAAPLLLIIVALLSSADGIFQSWINAIPQVLEQAGLDAVVARMLTALVITIYLFCFMWSLLFPGKPRQAPSAPPEGEKAAIGMNAVTAGTVLVCVNAVYALFAFLQFSYLFGAAEGLLPEGMAYAEYARQGFAELVLLCLMNQGLLLMGLHFILPAGALGELARRVLLSLLVCSTFVMLASAYIRLSLYEQAYGYTHARLLAHGFMIFLGLLLAAALIRVWVDRFSLAKAYLCGAIVAYVVINYANLDARVAENNAERYAASGEIDIPYLLTLSADAAPAVMKLHRRYPDLAELEGWLEELRKKAGDREHWASWNLSWQRVEP